MRFAPIGSFQSEGIVRAAAWCSTVASAVQIGVSLYTALAGGFRLQLGPLRISASTWSVPLLQACFCGMAAAWLFHRLGAPAIVMRRLLWTAVSIGSVASLVVSYRLAGQSLVVGSGEGGWIFGFIQPLGIAPLFVATLVGAAGLAMLAWSSRPDQSEWWTIAAWMVVGLGLQAGLRSLTPFTFERIFASDTANSFYSVTQQYGAARVLAQFSTLREQWPLHAHSNMPGKLMLVYALELISNRPTVLAWLIVFVSNLGGVLLYLFVRDFTGHRRLALYSLVLYLFVPGKLFFLPLLNTVTPTLALAWMVLAQRWLLTGRPSFAVATGVMLYVVPFFEPLPLVLGVLVAALAASAVWRGSLGWKRLAAHAALAMAAFLATHFAVRSCLDFDLFEALRHVATDAVAFNREAARPYGIWIQQNVYDFLFAAGACQAVLFCAALADGLHEGGWTMRALAQPIVLFCLALAAMLAAVDLSGVNRGEVIRLWVFLECLFQVPAAYACAKINDRRAIGLVVMTTIVQDALGTSMVGFVVP